MIPRIVLGLLALVVVAGWPAALFNFTKWRDLDVSFEISETERAKLEKDIDLIRKDLETQIETTGRLESFPQRYCRLL